MSLKAEWKVEVADASIVVEFDSESKAKARFNELVKQRYDHEVVKLYRIGSNGALIPEQTQMGHKRLTGQQ